MSQSRHPNPISPQIVHADIVILFIYKIEVPRSVCPHVGQALTLHPIAEEADPTLCTRRPYPVHHFSVERVARHILPGRTISHPLTILLDAFLALALSLPLTNRRLSGPF